jgi:hypothetical protein
LARLTFSSYKTPSAENPLETFQQTIL